MIFRIIRNRWTTALDPKTWKWTIHTRYNSNPFLADQISHQDQNQKSTEWSLTKWGTALESVFLSWWVFRSLELWLVVWLPFFIFPYIRNNHPNWRSYFSEGFKPPTRTSIPVMFFSIRIWNHLVTWWHILDESSRMGLPSWQISPKYVLSVSRTSWKITGFFYMELFCWWFVRSFHPVRMFQYKNHPAIAYCCTTDWKPRTRWRLPCKSELKAGCTHRKSWRRRTSLKSLEM